MNTQTERPSDTEVLDAITRVMSGTEWDSDTFDKIAAAILRTGRTIADPNDTQTEPGVMWVSPERFATEQATHDGWTIRTDDSRCRILTMGDGRQYGEQAQPAKVPDGELVCPRCLSGDDLWSAETSTTEYPVNLFGENGKVQVEYPGTSASRTFDEGTEYAGDIWCRRCIDGSLTESDLVAAQTPQEREDAE